MMSRKNQMEKPHRRKRYAPLIWLLAVALSAISLLFSHGVSAQTPDPPPGKLYLPLLLQPALSPTLPFAQRQPVLDAIRQQFDAMPGVNVDDERAALTAFILTQPHIAAAGVEEDGSVWGRFSDGRLLIIAATPPSTGASQTENFIPAQTAISPANLPSTDTAYVFNALGTCFQNQAAQISTWLMNQNYTVSPISPTVPELRTVKNAALFYIDTHGGSARTITNGLMYAMWTGTPVTLQWDVTLGNDLFAGRLVYFLAGHNTAAPPATNCISEWHYALTDSFVSTYMTFAPHSFVFFNGCSSASLAAASMQQAFAQAGAAAYAGWTLPVDDPDANFVAQALFDGLLAANSLGPPTPPMRPFDLTSLHADLVANGLDHSTYCSAPNGSCPPNIIIDAILQIIDLNVDPADDFSLLAPTIAWAEPRDPSCCNSPNLVRLDVHGQFGSEPGQVLLGNEPLRVLSWMTHTIQTELPPHGPGSAGDIVVKVRDHASNPAPLTEWRGQVHWREEYDQVYGPGPFAEVTCDLHLRANFHARRMNFDGDAEWPQFASVNESQDSRCTWEMGGEATWIEPSTGVRVRWALNGSGEFAWRPPSSGPGPYLGFSGTIAPRETDRYIGLNANGSVSGEYTVYRDGVFAYTTAQSLLGTGPVKMSVDAKFNVLAGNSTFFFPQGGPVTTTWDAIPARFAPNDQTPG